MAHLTQGHEEIWVSYFSGASGLSMHCMSRWKSSPGSSVTWDCAVRSLNAAFIVVPFLISRAHVSPRSYLAAHIFSSNFHFVLIVSVSFFILWRNPGVSHDFFFFFFFLSLHCPWGYSVIVLPLISLPEANQAWKLHYSLCLSWTLCQG